MHPPRQLVHQHHQEQGQHQGGQDRPEPQQGRAGGDHRQHQDAIADGVDRQVAIERRRRGRAGHRRAELTALVAKGEGESGAAMRNWIGSVLGITVGGWNASIARGLAGMGTIRHLNARAPQ